MNKIVKSFNRYQERPKYDGLDSITIEGQKLKVEEIHVMAARKKPVTEPVLDNDVVKKNKKAEDSLIVNELSKPDFESLIYYLLRGPAHKAEIVKTATVRALKRLRLKSDKSKARTKTVKGVSSQGDAGSVVIWTSKIQPDHKRSIKQLVILDATAGSRNT